MKLSGYLFCLSLAMAASVTPASAHYVYFNHSPVANQCESALTLFPGRTVIRPLSGTVLAKTRVEEVRLAMVLSYYPTENMIVRELATCSFDQCRQDSLRLSCVGGLGDAQTSQTVLFKLRKGRTKRR